MKILDVTIKLQLRKEQIVLLKKQLTEIMDILSISRENRSFTYILPAIQNLKNNLGSEQEETELYECHSQSHYREVLRWEIFMEQELRFGLDSGRMVYFPALIASKYFDL